MRDGVQIIFTLLCPNRAKRYISTIKPDSAPHDLYPHDADTMTMNAPMEMKADEVLRVNLEVLKREHRDLDQAIHALEVSGRGDQLTLRRLKKQKLGLKDRISRIEDILLPDIIA